MIFPETSPDLEEVELRVVESDVAVRDWVSYKFSSNFLTPTDGWSFVLGDEGLSPDVQDGLVIGSTVKLLIGGHQQAAGFIDSIDRQASKGSGIEWTVEGRDVLSPAVDSGIDPHKRFKPTQTLTDVVVGALAGFPWGTEADFEEDNDTNINVMTGQLRGTKTTKKGKVMKNAGAGQLRPHPNEGAFAFATRISQRFGLWVWPSANGDKLIVGKPSFEVPNPILYRLTRRFDGRGNNIESGGAKDDITDQPLAIVADGFSGGGEYGKSKIRCVMHNPFVELIDKDPVDVVNELVAKNKGAKIIVHRVEPKGEPILVRMPRIVYLHDEESHTMEQLENFVRREMSLQTRKIKAANYTVEGHFCVTPDGRKVPWAVDTIVDVEDEVARIREPMWVMGRTFEKSRGGGTKTSLELIKLNTLEF